jgi:hypothetical protein
MPNTHKIAKLEGSRPLGRLPRRWVGNIKRARNVLTPCKTADLTRRLCSVKLVRRTGTGRVRDTRMGSQGTLLTPNVVESSAEKSSATH